MKNILPKFDFNDITLVPKNISFIDSRDQCDVYDDTNKLKLICSPMDTVIDDNNVDIFNKLGILTCSIRKQQIDLNQHKYSFISIGLDQFEDIINNYNVYEYLYSGQGLLVDIANAHQNKLFELTKKFKNIFPNIPLMVGNIANPETYNKYCEILTSNDFLRCGIGGGSACTSSINTGIHYPYASLIEECYLIKANWPDSKCPQIVADGGFRNFDDINKAYSLGADYCMLGSIFSKSLEASGDTYYKSINVTYIKKWMYKNGFKLKRKYRGMSTKEVQKSIGKTTLRTSEGISKVNKVEYTLAGWIDNYKSYLKSCMSYSGIRHIKDFIGDRSYIFITQNALTRFKK